MRRASLTGLGSSRRRTAALALLAVVGASPAQAANEAHVRTPVVWPRECGRVVERAVDPVTLLTYDIPQEDLELTPEELDDSRTHQFIGFCRQHPYSELLPPWITRDDVDRSVAAEIIGADVVSYREILDETTVWADCFVRITADDARRPISFAAAAEPIAWDTSAVPLGVWSVSGYTFEPPFNLWTDRGGFIKVVDARDDPEQDVPALGLLGTEQAVEVHEPLAFEACADFAGPGRVEFEWAVLAPSLDWQPLATVELEQDLEWTPELFAPEAAAGHQILIRGRLIDGAGRSYEAHAPARIDVADCPADGCPPPPSTDPETGEPSAPAPGGCEVIGGSRLSPLWLLVLALALWMRPKLGRRARASAD